MNSIDFVSVFWQIISFSVRTIRFLHPSVSTPIPSWRCLPPGLHTPRTTSWTLGSHRETNPAQPQLIARGNATREPGISYCGFVWDFDFSMFRVFYVFLSFGRSFWPELSNKKKTPALWIFLVLFRAHVTKIRPIS